MRTTKRIPILLDVLGSPGARLLQVLEPGVSVESRVSAARRSSQGKSKIFSNRLQMQRQAHRQRQKQTWYKRAGQELFGGFVLLLFL